MTGPLLILGPQRPAPDLPRALAAHGVTGPIAVITGGWRHDEDELDALRRDLPGHKLVHLPIYQWFDEVHAEEPVLAAAYNERQRRIRQYKAAYRAQLGAALDALSATQALMDRDAGLFQPELDFIVQSLRAIDERTVQRVNQIRDELPAAAQPWEYPAARDRHGRIKDALQSCGALLIAGGHVGVLRNRMYFLGLDVLLGNFLARGGLLCAWSAGAMTLADRVVLFYDDPPDGRGEAEVLDSGLRLTPGLVYLPHAAQRLRLSDHRRMARLAHRLSPERGVTLENGAWIEFVDGGWRSQGKLGAAGLLQPDGTLHHPAPGEALDLPAPRLSAEARVVTP